MFGFMVLVLFCSQALMGQQTVSGLVSDSDGPLPGATVIVQGTDNGVTTDFDGNFSIQASEGDVLELSYVGFQTQTFTISANQDTISVVLEADNELEEVVVVAFGKQTKETIVGSVAVISSESINKQSATTITQAIQGSIPGINIINPGGIPGTNPTIRIRGIGSINAEASPLIIVDGAPFNGNLNSIAQEQVASISVLKDASSTSLYLSLIHI